MVHVPDEFIMAYADGQLSAEERVWFESMLTTEPGLRGRLQPFLATGPGQWAVFDAILSAPVPERLTAAVRLGPQPARPAGARSPSTQRTAAGTWAGVVERFFPDGFGWQPALGYAATLLVGVGLGTALLDTGPTDDALMRADRDGFVATGRLQQALDGTPSNAKGLVKEGDIRPVLSLRDREGRFCRQYEIVARTQKGPQGLACRETDGEWRITVLTGGADHSGVARPASQDDGARFEGMVGTAVKNLPGHSELSAAEELYLIEKGWTGAPAADGDAPGN